MLESRLANSFRLQSLVMAVLLARELELSVWDAKSGIWEAEATQGEAGLEGVVFHRGSRSKGA